MDKKDAKEIISRQHGDEAFKKAEDTSVKNKKKITIDHLGTANMLLKYLSVIPGVPMWSRKIMQMKIQNPGISNMQVALALGLREYEVGLYEKDGINRVSQYLSKISMQDGVDKFNTERVIQNEVKQLRLNPELAQAGQGDRDVTTEVNKLI